VKSCVALANEDLAAGKDSFAFIAHCWYREDIQSKPSKLVLRPAKSILPVCYYIKVFCLLRRVLDAWFLNILLKLINYRMVVFIVGVFRSKAFVVGR